MGIFGSKIYQCAYKPKATECGKLKFGHDIGSDRGFMRTNFGGARSRDRIFRGRKSAKGYKFKPVLLDKDQY